MNHGADPDDWFGKSEEQRYTEYVARKLRLEEIVTSVRMHRADQCDGAPLCPGADASDMLTQISPWQLGDFVSTCLAALADAHEQTENLRVQLDQERSRVKALGQQRVTAEREAEAAWQAYRLEHEKNEALSAGPHAPLIRIDLPEDDGGGL